MRNSCGLANSQLKRTLEPMLVARDLYWTCLAENPNFAPAWAWLGRCCWFLDKFSTVAPQDRSWRKPHFNARSPLIPIWPPLTSSIRCCRWIWAGQMRQ